MRSEYTNQIVNFFAQNEILVYAGIIGGALIAAQIVISVLFPSRF